MRHRRKTYWPLLKFAAVLSGIFTIFFVAFAAYVITHNGEMQGESDLLLLLLVGLSVIFGAGCIGIFTKRWWGRGIMTFVSILYLFAFPIGTILSIYLLKALAFHKHEFK